ncbi:MAG: aminotransferase class III-fold pyridoxal phosphate-dependent enzyme, partial [Parvibaculum sp.]
DMINMAKGLSSGYQPIAAVGLGKRVGDVIFNSDEEWSHGFTYSGHPVAAAVALANLELMQKEKLVEKAGGATGAHFQKRLAELAGHPLVGQTRGVGLLGAIELVKNKKTREKFPDVGTTGTMCRNHCFSNGLIMRAIGDTMVLSPPLTITESEIDELFGLARRCIDLTAKDLGVS